MPPALSKDWLAVAGLVLAMLLWGSSFIAMKLAFQVYDPLVVIFGRMLVASLCFLAFWSRFRRVRLRSTDYPYLILMVLCEPCLYFLFEAAALTYTSASQAGMIVALLPVMVVAAAGLFLREKLNRRTVTGLAMAVIGAAVLGLAAEDTAHAPAPLLGNFLEFLAMVCATGYTILIKRLTRDYDPFFLTALQALAGTLFFLPLLALPDIEWPTALEPRPLLAIVYLGAVITLGAYGLYNYALSRLPASQVSVFVNLIPVFTVILGILVLEERFTPVQFAASVMVFAGVMVSQWGEHQARKRLIRAERVAAGGEQ